MAKVKINDKVSDRDFETAYLKDCNMIITKNTYNDISLESAKELYSENLKRKKYLKYDYYVFQFDSSEKKEIESESKREVVEADFKEVKVKNKPKKKKVGAY